MRERSFFSFLILCALVIAGVMGCAGCTSDDAPDCLACFIDGVCYNDGQGNPDNACQVCDTAASASGWSDDDGAGCDDGVFCNGADSCLGGACSEHAGDPCPDDGLYCNGAESCNESGESCDHGGDPCTLPEVCDEAADGCGLTCSGCDIDGICYDDGQSNPDNACQACDAAASASGWSDDDGAGCDDGVFCNGADTCLGGACSEHAGDPCPDDGLYCNGEESCNESGGTCDHAGDPCTPSEYCDEDAGECVPMTPSEQIAAARAAPDGAVSQPLDNVYVTYTKAAVGDDSAGFFVQAEQAGPALFVEVDPAGLGIAAGDELSFVISQMGTSQSRRQATAIHGLTVITAGNSLAGLVQDVSAAADLVTALDDYEAELISVDGTLAGDFASAGAGHIAAQMDTAAVVADADLQLRIPDMLNATLDLEAGCTLTVTRTPLWRAGTAAQVSAYSVSEVTVFSCPAPQVLSAAATDESTVVITMSRQIEPTSVLPDGSQFTFDLGLTAAAASASGNEITVLTSVQTSGVTYLVTVASTVTDRLGAGVDPAANSTFFMGFP